MTKTKDIKNTIADFLDEVAGTDENIRIIYRWFNTVPSEFPCVMVYLKSIDEERLDFQNDQVNTDYQMKLCLPYPEKSDKNVLEDLRMDCIDDIMGRLRKKDAIETLGGETFKTQITAGEPYIELEAGFPMIVTDLTFETARSEFIEE